MGGGGWGPGEKGAGGVFEVGTEEARSERNRGKLCNNILQVKKRKEADVTQKNGVGTRIKEYRKWEV